MIGGCFKNFFAMIGCFVLLLIVLVLTWYFWPEIKELYDERIAAGGMFLMTRRSCRSLRPRGW